MPCRDTRIGRRSHARGTGPTESRGTGGANEPESIAESGAVGSGDTNLDRCGAGLDASTRSGHLTAAKTFSVGKISGRRRPPGKQTRRNAARSGAQSGSLQSNAKPHPAPGRPPDGVHLAASGNGSAPTATDASASNGLDTLPRLHGNTPNERSRTNNGKRRNERPTRRNNPHPADRRQHGPKDHGDPLGETAGRVAKSTRANIGHGTRSTGRDDSSYNSNSGRKTRDKRSPNNSNSNRKTGDERIFRQRQLGLRNRQMKKERHRKRRQ